MSERDELAATIEDALTLSHGIIAWTGAAQEEIAAAVLAAGYRKPRIITTAEELDALPNGSVVKADLTSHHSGGWNLAYQRWEDGDWHRGARAASTHPDYIIPATVLWEPLP